MTSSVEQDWLVDTAGVSVREFYAELGIVLPDKQGVEAGVRCFANPQAHNRDDRDPSCSVNLLTGLWNCQGCGEHGNAFRAAQLLGLSDRQAALLAQRHGLFLSLEKADQLKRPKLPGERQMKTWRQALRENQTVLRRLWEVKGWTPRAAVRLGCGWDGERIVFPVRSAKLKLVGFVRYLPGGEPKSVALPGSKRDLFPAPELIHRRHPLFLVEGEPDAVAVRSLGWWGVAVPGAGSWRGEWAARFLGRRVVVLCDCDPQGRTLAARVAGDVLGATIVDLCPARSDGWDVGDAVREASCEGGLGQASRVLGRLVA